MTITLVPNDRPVDRKPLGPRHEGPYYGHALKRVIAPPPLRRSDRLMAWTLIGMIGVAIGCAYLIVSYAR